MDYEEPITAAEALLGGSDVVHFGIVSVKWDDGEYVFVSQDSGRSLGRVDADDVEGSKDLADRISGYNHAELETM